MKNAAAVLDPGPPASLLFRRRLRFGRAVRDVAGSREVIRSLAERELKARYKQAVLGFGWALVTPLALMLILTLFFRRVVRVDTGGAPYQLFAYLALLPWTFFSTSVSQGGQSLVLNAPLLNKVSCPREVFPLASILVAGIDMAVATTALVALFAITGFAPKTTSVWVPLLFGVQVAFSVGVSLMVSIVIVYLRDLRHALPIILQLGLFATPVAYGIEAVPRSLQVPYVCLNPLAAVIDGYRRTVLSGLPPDPRLIGPAAITATGVLIGGYILFKRLEGGIADLA